MSEGNTNKATPATVGGSPSTTLGMSRRPSKKSSSSISTISDSDKDKDKDEEKEATESPTAKGTGNAASLFSSPSSMFLPVAPKLPSKCPLFCCFYAEFDIKKGPVIRNQSPEGFMDQDIHVGLDRIHNMLEETFQKLAQRGDAVRSRSSSDDDDGGPIREKQDEEPLNSEKKGSQTVAVGSANAHDDRKEIKETTTSNSDLADENEPGSSKRHFESSSQHPNTQQQAQTQQGLSIFDSTSEYIITGTELTSKIITLSTHSWHIMARPTMISDDRYERNALLFSVGFCLRRAADPSPFRPLLSKLATTLQAMEEESQFVTKPNKPTTGVPSNPSLNNHNGNPGLQVLLERVLISLNSSEWECNMVLDPSNALHLKLYHPPKPEASPVHEYQVPILLRRDFQLQMFDWDLAMNWVILHIDGIINAKQISIKAEVDLEMVLACLRVLKHHGMIALISPFLYSNRYECTPKATAILAGKDTSLLDEALEFSWKRGPGASTTFPHPSAVPLSPNQNPQQPPQAHQGGSYSSNGAGEGDHANTNFSTTSHSSHYLHQAHSHHAVVGSPYAPSHLGLALSSTSYHPPESFMGTSHRSTNHKLAMMAAAASAAHASSPLERESTSAAYRMKLESANNSGTTMAEKDPEVVRRRRVFRSALAELFCACSRNFSFGDLWLALTTEAPPPHTLVFPATNHTNHRNGQRTYRSGSISEDYPTDGSFSDNLDHTLSPSESYAYEHLRQQNKNPRQSSGTGIIDWRDFLDTQLDHRRFTTFGLIHGLIKRIHCFPCYPYPFPCRPPSRDTDVSAIPTGSPSTLPQFATGKYSEMQAFSSAALGNFNHNNTAPNSSSSTSFEDDTQEDYGLARLAASMMDGSRCDDEISCALEAPIQRLVELVEWYGQRKVICLHAARIED